MDARTARNAIENDAVVDSAESGRDVQRQREKNSSSIDRMNTDVSSFSTAPLQPQNFQIAIGRMQLAISYRHRIGARKAQDVKTANRQDVKLQDLKMRDKSALFGPSFLRPTFQRPVISNVLHFQSSPHNDELAFVVKHTRTRMTD